MKVIREISKSIDPMEIREIYNNGHKLAVKYKENTFLDFENYIVDSKGDGCLEDAEDFSVRDCFLLENGELFAKGGEFVVVDSVVDANNLARCVAAEKGDRKYIVDFCLFCLFDEEAEDFVMDAESVYEIELK